MSRDPAERIAHSEKTQGIKQRTRGWGGTESGVRLLGRLPLRGLGVKHSQSAWRMRRGGRDGEIRQRSEDRGQRTEDGRQRTEDIRSSQLTAHRNKTHE
jgi:hypothetical protein